MGSRFLDLDSLVSKPHICSYCGRNEEKDIVKVEEVPFDIEGVPMKINLCKTCKSDKRTEAHILYLLYDGLLLSGNKNIKVLKNAIDEETRMLHKIEKKVREFRRKQKEFEQTIKRIDPSFVYRPKDVERIKVSKNLEVEVTDNERT